MIRRISAIFLVLCMALSLMPVQAFATEMDAAKFQPLVDEEIEAFEESEALEEFYSDDEALANIPEPYAEVTSGNCGDNLTWMLDSAGTMTISGTGDMTDYQSISNEPWYSIRSSIKAVVIGENVTSIGDNTFTFCALTSVSIPNSVTRIGVRAFSGCNILESVIIPSSVTTIGRAAFSSCTNLEEIKVSTENSIYSDLDGILFDKNKETLVTYPAGKQGHYSIPNSVTNIGEDAFSYCHNLTSVTISNSVTSIGASAFTGCSGLTNVMIPNSVTMIDGFTFSYCKGLTNVTIPNSVTTIGSWAFTGCDALTSITIPNSVTMISESAFDICDKLTEIKVLDENPAYSDIDGVLFDKNKESLIIYPAGKQGHYDIPNGVIHIGEQAFYYCEGLTSLAIPNRVISIKDGAFLGCERLKYVTIPKSVTNIGYDAFADCDSLMDVYYGGNENEWQSIINYNDDAALKNATIHYNSTGPETDPSKPTTPDQPSLPAGITQLYPANGSTFDYANSSADTRPRIYFDREVANAGGNRAELDFSVGTLQIHRASDDAVVYEVTASGSNYSTKMPLWGEGEDVSSPKAIRLEGVQPNLTAGTEYYVTMPAGFIQFADGSASPAIGKRDWAFTTKVFEKNGSFSFSGTNGTNISYNYSYSDTYFDQISSQYNHDLANMSLNLALSAFNAPDSATSGYKEKVSAQNVRKLLYELEFEKIETNILEANNSYEGMPYTHSIAAAYGYRQLTSTASKNYTLIAVAIRGGNYEAEWGGNAEVGEDGNHSGFQKAADKVVEGLKKYIQNEDIEGPIKLWITGYSRAAATANLVAAAIDEGFLFAGDQTINEGEVQLSLSNVFAYTFETPMPTTNHSDDPIYNNIHNIVNPVDLVPKLAPLGWNFTRYGITYYMPSAETDSKYLDFVQRIGREYAKIVKGTNNGELMLITHLDNQGALLDNLLNLLSKNILLREKYSPKFESIIVPLVSEWLGAKGFQYSDAIADALLEYLNNYPEDIDDIVKALKSVIGNKIVWALVLEQGLEHLSKAVGIVDETSTEQIVELLKEIGGIIFQSHYPEVTLAWMRTINGVRELNSSDIKYRQLYVNCPVDVFVYNENEQLVAQIINDEPVILNNSSIPAYVNGDEQKIVILPPDGSFTVKVAATDDGTVTYAMEEYCIDNGSTDRLVSYQNIAIKKGDVLTGSVENLDNSTTAQYPLYRNDESRSLIPTINQQYGKPFETSPNLPSTSSPSSSNSSNNHSSSSSQVTSSINVGSVSNGKVTVSPKSAAKGKTITVTTTPNSGYVLDSLTVKDQTGKTLDLTDKGDGVYTFTMPSGKVNVDAVFRRAEQQTSSTAPSIFFFDITDDFWAKEAIDWVSSKGYMSGYAAKTFDPNGYLTRQQLWMILARLGGETPANMAEAKAWAIRNGVSDGTNPGTSVTRQQLVTFLYRYCSLKGYPISGSGTLEAFTDRSNVSGYAQDAMAWAVGNGIVNGTTQTTLAPTGNATRAQFAVILKRFYEQVVEG